MVLDARHRVLAQLPGYGADGRDDDHRNTTQRGRLGPSGRFVGRDLVADPLLGAGFVLTGKAHWGVVPPRRASVPTGPRVNDRDQRLPRSMSHPRPGRCLDGVSTYQPVGTATDTATNQRRRDGAHDPHPPAEITGVK